MAPAGLCQLPQPGESTGSSARTAWASSRRTGSLTTCACNILCVNPDHMEPVTHAENMRRARLTMCRAGLHGLTDPANQHFDKDGQRRGCYACPKDEAAAFTTRTGRDIDVCSCNKGKDGKPAQFTVTTAKGGTQAVASEQRLGRSSGSPASAYAEGVSPCWGEGGVDGPGTVSSSLPEEAPPVPVRRGAAAVRG